MRYGILLLGVLLAGCGGGDSYDPHSDNHGYGYHYDEETAAGVRYRTDLDPGQWRPEAEQIDAAVLSVAACLGVEARADVAVILVNHLDKGAGVQGWYHWSPPLILVQYSPLGWDMLDMLRHELVHHLLHLHTGDSDSAHESPCYPTGTIL